MRIHFVGVKGTGMSALAQISCKMEHAEITGSDVADRFFTDAVLEKAGITVLPFDPKNIDGVDLVVASAAYGKEHPEIARALAKGIPVLTYPEYLGRLMAKKRGISVTGTHGKTTTTAMLGSILLNAGLDPTIVVGSAVPVLGGNSYAGSGDFFLAESCEYRRHFLNYNPEFLVILNMDLDHPDYYADLDDVVSAFQGLAAKVPAHGKVVIWGDDPNWQRIKTTAPVVTYGFQEHNDFRAINLAFKGEHTSFEIIHNGKNLGRFNLKVTGTHNVLNALAALGLADALGVGMDIIQSSLAQFTGTKRRFEKLGEYQGAVIMDDYAHHPTEVSATLEGARLAFPDRRIVAVFQPHTYSRTEKLLDEFSKSFVNADQVIITDIFASAREQGKGGVSGEDLARKITATGIDALFLPDFKSIKDYLASHLGQDHLVLTMGAGDIYKVGQELIG